MVYIPLLNSLPLSLGPLYWERVRTAWEVRQLGDSATSTGGMVLLIIMNGKLTRKKDGLCEFKMFCDIKKKPM